ncbi:HPP family-domain-containing protein [Lophiotrema nucula]|uniref:HPP family-domain-containing protein n=1 Tax=Lophiotrema nucula TaxID=690887 RepID=A0A6A5Z702_9PLEO|nr:HPP family-domain-containing protein [Lophiotrema nucula]
MNSLQSSREWNFEIDHYLNKVLPPSPLHKLPPPLSRFLGYRKEQKQDVGNILGAFWSLVGAFCGLAVIAGVFNNTLSIQVHHPPALIASFGASAILEYNSIRSPLGQPRNALLGHTFSALIGVGFTKLFRLRSDFEKIKWLCGAISCGTASAIMLLSGTVHPPGGASAVLAATLPEVTDMGWYFVPLVMYGTTLMLVVGLIINNIQRQFPVYWWTPMDLRKERIEDVEKWPDARGSMERKITEQERLSQPREIRISGFDVSLPPDLPLNEAEAAALQGLMNRLRDEELKRKPSSTPSTACTAVPSYDTRPGSETAFFVPPA